eukprot:5577083-Amphidinium_carterae.1
MDFDLRISLPRLIDKHDRTSHKGDIEQIHTALSNIYTVLARHEANTENIVTREVARDERSIGLMTDSIRFDKCCKFLEVPAQGDDEPGTGGAP